MKTFGDLKVGDTLYEHIGSQILKHTVVRTDFIEGSKLCSIIHKEATLGLEEVQTILKDETSVFPFYTSIQEIQDETEFLVMNLKLLKEGVSC